MPPKPTLHELASRIERCESACRIVTGGGDTDKSLITRVDRLEQKLSGIMWALRLIGGAALTALAGAVWQLVKGAG